MQPATSRVLHLHHFQPSISFYTSALQPLDYQIVGRAQGSVTLGIPADTNHISDVIIAVASPKSSVQSPKYHITFAASTPAAVHRFFKAARIAGGRSCQDPHVSGDRSSRLSAVVDDLDGNSIEVVHQPVTLDDSGDGFTISKITGWAANVADSIGKMREAYTSTRSGTSSSSSSRRDQTPSAYSHASSERSRSSVISPNQEASRAATKATGQTSGTTFDVVATVLGAAAAGVAVAGALRQHFDEKDVQIIDNGPNQPVMVQPRSTDSGVTTARVIELEDLDRWTRGSRRSRSGPSEVNILPAGSSVRSPASRPPVGRGISNRVGVSRYEPDTRYSVVSKKSPAADERDGFYQSRSPKRTQLIMAPPPSSHRSYRSRDGEGSRPMSSGSPTYVEYGGVSGSTASASKSPRYEPSAGSSSSLRSSFTSHHRPALVSRRRSSFSSDASTLRPSNAPSRTYSVQHTRSRSRSNKPKPLDLDSKSHYPESNYSSKSGGSRVVYTYAPRSGKGREPPKEELTEKAIREHLKHLHVSDEPLTPDDSISQVSTRVSTRRGATYVY